jgi:hypothetical protein
MNTFCKDLENIPAARKLADELFGENSIFFAVPGGVSVVVSGCVRMSYMSRQVVCINILNILYYSPPPKKSANSGKSKLAKPSQLKGQSLPDP